MSQYCTMRSLSAIEAHILETYGVVRDIGVFKQEGILHAVIRPNLPLFEERGILNIREYMRLDVLDRYSQHVPAEEKIRQFTLIRKELPKNEQEEIRQEKLEEFVRDAFVRSVPISKPDFQAYRLIKNFLQHLIRQEIFPDDHLEIDLALSSLDKVQLFVFLKSTFGIELTERDLLAHFTVLSLADYIRQRSQRKVEQLPERIDLESVRWDKILTGHTSLRLPNSRLTHDIVLSTTGLFARWYFRLHATGQAHIPESPVIIAANHQCFFDGFIMGYFLPRSFMKNSYVFAVDKHFNTPFRRFVADTSTVIVMNINHDLRIALQKMAAVLQKGSNVFIFPEGTRTKDGQLSPFKPTFAILSREFDVPIVPTVIQGGFEAMPIGGGFPKPFKKISLRFLPPIFPGSRSYQEISDHVRGEIEKHLNEEP